MVLVLSAAVLVFVIGKYLPKLAFSSLESKTIEYENEYVYEYAKNSIAVCAKFSSRRPWCGNNLALIGFIPARMET